MENLRTFPKDDHWGDVISEIKLAEGIHPDALKGIEEFSHLDIIFYFHQVKEEHIHYKARRPRNNKNYPETGIFAQRGKTGRTGSARPLSPSLKNPGASL